ncbi:MAG TPA: PEP-CTERM sorting domain-containing protein [Aquabacterium sp.]|nr:PEP-CTERM sorting domain-containing protein [Aquabacterium sp.]
MHFTLRIVALTAALVAPLPAALAREIPLDFNGFSNVTAPTAVGTLEGLQFQGAFAYGEGMLDDATEPGGLADGSRGRGGFLLNQSRDVTVDPSSITISLARATTTTRGAASTSTAGTTEFFDAIAFNLFTRGASNAIYGTDANGTESLVRTFTGGGGFWTTTPIVIDIDNAERFVSLRFSAGGAAFALDDMLVTLATATVPGGTVPEPASYGLVGLALLAAGTATRRNKARG